MEVLIGVFIFYVIYHVIKDISTPRRKSFDVGEYCNYVNKHGQEEADRQRKNGMFDL